MKRRIAIQGYKGSSHEMAARRFYAPDAACPIPGGGGIEVVECATFEQLFERVADHRADAAVMAIENTVSGGLLPNFELLRSNSLPVRGETYLRIEQNLMALPIPGHEWQYFFYADIRFESYERYRQALAAIRPLMEELRILGEYISAL